MTNIIPSGTIKAVPDQIRALATWLEDSQTDPQGLFVQGKAWLSDLSGVDYAGGAPLNYDQAAPRGDGEVGYIGADLDSIGILPGWCLDDSYWTTAKQLKKRVDIQLLELYNRLDPGPGPGSLSGAVSIHDMVSTMVSTLRQVADDYDKNSDKVAGELSKLAEQLSSTSAGGNSGGSSSGSRS